MEFKKTSYCEGGETILHCPDCGSEYVHLVRFSSPNGERPSIVLDFECEEGHSFSSYLHNHKGHMISSISIETKEPNG